MVLVDTVTNLEDTPIEKFRQFTSMWILTTSDGDLKAEINTRIARATTSYSKLSTIWKFKILRLST